MMKKLIALFLAVSCCFSCFGVVSYAAFNTEPGSDSTEILDDDALQSEKHSFFDFIEEFKQKLTAIVRIGDTVIAEAGAQRNELGWDFSPYIKILGYPLQQIVRFFQNIRDYF